MVAMNLSDLTFPRLAAHFQLTQFAFPVRLDEDSPTIGIRTPVTDNVPDECVAFLLARLRSAGVGRVRLYSINRCTISLSENRFVKLGGVDDVLFDIHDLSLCGLAG